MPKEGGPGHIDFRELGPQLFSKGMEKNKNSKTWMILNFFLNEENLDLVVISKIKYPPNTDMYPENSTSLAR